MSEPAICEWCEDWLTACDEFGGCQAAQLRKAKRKSADLQAELAACREERDHAMRQSALAIADKVDLRKDRDEAVKLLRPAVQAGGMLVAMLTDFRDQWKDDEFKAAWYKSAIGRFNAASEFLNTHDAARAGRGEGGE